MRAHIVLDGREDRDFDSMGSFERRDAAAVSLRYFFFFLLANLVRIVELLEELCRVLDAIDAEIEIVDVLIAGPQARRFVWRVSAIRCQREVGLGANNGWRRLDGRHRSPCGARANNVESED